MSYPTWSPPVAADPPILDGVTFPGIPTGISREPSAPAAVVRMFDGRGVVLHRSGTAAQPLGEVSAHTWSFGIDTESEALWYALKRLQRTAAVGEWVDYRDEACHWATVAGTLTYDLKRAPAAVVVAGFPAGDYPHRVLLDGVDLTVVSGAPSTGEAQLTATSIVLGDDPGAADLEARYIARYYVVVTQLPDQLPQFGELLATVSLTEVGG